MVRRVVERAFRAAERAPDRGDVLITVSHRPLAIAHRTAPLQLHAIVVNGVLQLNGAGRTASLASLGDLECYGGVRRRHEPASVSSRADESVDRDQSLACWPATLCPLARTATSSPVFRGVAAIRARTPRVLSSMPSRALYVH